MRSEDFQPLSWREKSSRFQEIAREAARGFGLDDPSPELVGDMEGHVESGGLLGNVKFRIADRETYLLNIYYVFSGNPDRLGLDRRLAFHRWSRHLSDFGIQVQQPVPSLEGLLISKATIALTTGRQVDYAAVLTTWIEGTPLDETSRRDIVHIARMQAKLHTLSEGWHHPRELAQTFDIDTLESGMENLRMPVEDGRVTASDFKTVDAAMSKASNKVTRCLSREEATWGVCHSDLKAHNCLHTPDGIAVLDCDGATLSYFAYDLARSIADLSPTMRESYIAEYAQHRDQDVHVGGLLESFILLDRYRTWMYWATSDHRYTWVPEFASRECTWFLRGRTIPTQARADSLSVYMRNAAQPNEPGGHAFWMTAISIVQEGLKETGHE